MGVEIRSLAGQLLVSLRPMMYSLALVGLLAPAMALAAPPAPTTRVRCEEPRSDTFYDYQAVNLWGNETIDFSRYKGKVVLAYNVASG